MSYKVTEAVKEESYSKTSISSSSSTMVSSNVGVDSADSLSLLSRMPGGDVPPTSLLQQSMAVANQDIQSSMRSAFDSDDSSIIRASQTTTSESRGDDSYSFEKSKIESAYKEDDTSVMKAMRASQAAMSTSTTTSDTGATTTSMKTTKSVSSYQESFSSDTSETMILGGPQS